MCDVIGLRASKWTQNLLTLAKVAGVLIVVVVSLLVAEPLGPAAQARKETPMWQSFGAAAKADADAAG